MNENLFPSEETLLDPALFGQEGKVRLLIDQKPWRLMLSLDGLKITKTGLVALLQFDQETSILPAREIANALKEGQSYKLQIEQDENLISQPFMDAQLVEKRFTAVGAELGFYFGGDDRPDEPIFQF